MHQPRQFAVRTAHESGAFDMLVQTLDGLSAAGLAGNAAAAPLRAQLARLNESSGAVARAVKDAAPPPEVAQAQAAQYQAFAQSLREMALLEASMQKVAESGQQVLQRLEQGRPQAGAAA